MKPRLYNRADNLKKMFALDEDDTRFAALPAKYSGRKLSGIKLKGLCSYYFPHYMEMPNFSWCNAQKSWKKHRGQQYKTKKAHLDFWYGTM